MRRGTGLALLAIASIYQLNKINKRRNESKVIDAKVRKELFARSERGSTRRSPVQIIKEQLKLEEELRRSDGEVPQDELKSEDKSIESDELIEVDSANLELTKISEQSEEEISVRSFADVQAEVRAKVEQEDSKEDEVVNSFENVEDAIEWLDGEEPTDPTVVYVAGKGRKYHLTKVCRGIRKDAELTELTLENAIDKGYSLCGWEDK